MPLVRKDPAPAGQALPADVLRQLIEGDPAERRSAAHHAVGLPGGVDVLGAALTTESDERVRDALFSALGRAATDASLDLLIPYVGADDPATRTAALDALRAMPAVVAPRLPSMLSDPDGDVRILSCDIARTLSASVAETLMCDLLDREGDANVCAGAVDVLAEVGGPASKLALSRCAARFDGEPFLGFAIAAVLERIGPSE